MEQRAVLRPYLHELDRYMEQLTDLSTSAKAWRKKKGRGNYLYCRYADDFVVLCDGTKEQAEAMRQKLLEFLAAELKLTLSMEKTKITHMGEGFRFLGFWIERNVGGSGRLAPRIRIPEEAATKFRAKMHKALSKSTHGDSLNTKIIALNRITRGWCQYYQTTSSPHFYFGKLTDEMYWLMAHWIGRKYKLSIAQVHRKFRRGSTLGTNQKTLLLPQVFKAKRYLAKTIHNPYLDTATAITREDWDVLLEEWGGTETRKGALDLKEWVYQRDKGICGICQEPVERWEADMDHKTPWSRFKRANAANHKDNLWILHRRCHKEKTKRDLYA
jgi:5-methylcytosine-specific restriction endonuclease McrA